MRLTIFLIICFIENKSIYAKQCICVHTNLCGDASANTNGAGLFDIRQAKSECPNYYEVCCENRIATIKPMDPQSSKDACGRQNILGFTSRILSDSENALFGEHPWAVLILLRDLNKERNMYRCGGSLIHPQVILTAGHCVIGSNPAHLTVRAGEWNTRSQEEPLPHQDMLVQEIYMHPNFQEGSLQNDVALLFLMEPFSMTDNVGIICLPPMNLVLEDGMCTASGWGKDAFKKGRHSSILKKVDLPLVQRDNCERDLRKTRLGEFFELHKSFLCAGGETNKDTCKGDGGSPLVCRIPGQKNRFFQLGIVSWGIGCGGQTPGVYTNVPLYIEWIESTFLNKNLDASFFKYLET